MAEELLIDIQKKLPEGEIIFRTSAPLVHSWTVLFGPSGSGKTTLALALLRPCSSGEAARRPRLPRRRQPPSRGGCRSAA